MFSVMGTLVGTVGPSFLLSLLAFLRSAISICWINMRLKRCLLPDAVCLLVVSSLHLSSVHLHLYLYLHQKYLYLYLQLQL